MKIPDIAEIDGIYGIRDPVLRRGFAEVVIFGLKHNLRIRCNGDTDEVILSRSKKGLRQGVRILSGRYLVEWMWCLQNQQGYEDGFRIQVRAGRKIRSFDFIAIGSMIAVFKATGWPNRKD